MNQNLEKTDSLLFDVDGTLWNSVAGIRISWQSVLDARYPGMRGPITDREICDCMGLELAEFGRRLFPMLDESLHAELLSACVDAENIYLGTNGAEMYPQMKETLMALAEKYPLAIISNCEDGYIQNFLAFTGLAPYIKDFESHGHTKLSKAENIRLVMQRNGFKHSCYIGDTDLDRRSSDKAGIPFIFANYGFGHTEDSLYQISCLAELKDLFL